MALRVRTFRALLAESASMLIFRISLLPSFMVLLTAGGDVAAILIYRDVDAVSAGIPKADETAGIGS